MEITDIITETIRFKYGLDSKDECIFKYNEHTFKVFFENIILLSKENKNVNYLESKDSLLQDLDSISHIDVISDFIKELVKHIMSYVHLKHKSFYVHNGLFALNYEPVFKRIYIRIHGLYIDRSNTEHFKYDIRQYGEKEIEIFNALYEELLKKI